MKSILIVEDDITYGMMNSKDMAWTKKGFHVSSASSIAVPRSISKPRRWTLILSDLRLPDRDGIDLLKCWENIPCHIPLIIMTGYATYSLPCKP